MSHGIFPTRINSTDAHTLAQRCCPTGFTLADASLSYFPFLGLSFQVVGITGAAKSLHGKQCGMVVDLVSGTPLMAPELLTLVSYAAEPPPGAIDLSTLQFRFNHARAIQAAKRALSAKLLGKFRLGSRFELELTQEIWPLWKPNWLISTTDKKLRFLVDGINGNVVSKAS